MITKRQIRKLVEEHVKGMNGSFEIEKVSAKANFLAGIIAILRLQSMNDIRFMNQIKYEKQD